jgi:hypothetical protein
MSFLEIFNFFTQTRGAQSGFLSFFSNFVTCKAKLPPGKNHANGGKSTKNGERIRQNTVTKRGKRVSGQKKTTTTTTTRIPGKKRAS